MQLSNPLFCQGLQRYIATIGLDRTIGRHNFACNKRSNNYEGANIIWKISQYRSINNSCANVFGLLNDKKITLYGAE